jgi:hypothetical protein
MNNKSIIRGAASTGLAFGILKAFKNIADPYTRMALGGIIGFGALAIGIREIGLGIWFGSGLQGTEMFQGGRITKNNLNETIFAINENEGLFEIPAKNLHDGTIEGFTYKGLNGVFKLSNGVHCSIFKDKRIFITGIGALVNKIRNSGFHDYKWCVKTGDGRWVELYKKSL